MAKPSAPGDAQTWQLDWPEATFLLSPGFTLATTSCKSEVQGVHPLCGGRSRPSPPDLVWKEGRARTTGQEQQGPRRKRARSIPPLSASGAREAGGFRGPANTEMGGAALRRPERWGSPRSRPESSLAGGLGVLLSCLPSQDPQRPGDWGPPQPAARLEVPAPSWNWLDRQLRRRDHTGAAGGQG